MKALLVCRYHDFHCSFCSEDEEELEEESSEDRKEAHDDEFASETAQDRRMIKREEPVFPTDREENFIQTGRRFFTSLETNELVFSFTFSAGIVRIWIYLYN